MSEIKFKATRRNIDGWRELDKSGDSEFDHDADSSDVISLRMKGSRKKIIIDCSHKTGIYRLVFDPEDFALDPFQTIDRGSDV